MKFLNKEFLFKSLGFIVLMGIIVLVLQLVSEHQKKGKVALGPGIKFEPAKIEEKIFEKETKVNPPPLDAKKPDESKKPEDLTEKEKPETASEASQPEVKGASPKPVIAGNEMKKPVVENIKPGVVKISDQAFIEIDKFRDQIDTKAASKKTDILYGWGVVDKYDKPDLAVRTLGGIPFAIDEKGEFYFRISLESKTVRPASMVSSAYSTTGIEAHDPKLRSIIKEAARSGLVSTGPDAMSYYYLFTLGTERYIINKVVNTFEWFIKAQKFDQAQAEDFRKSARLRINEAAGYMAGNLCCIVKDTSMLIFFDPFMLKKNDPILHNN